MLNITFTAAELAPLTTKQQAECFFVEQEVLRLTGQPYNVSLRDAMSDFLEGKRLPQYESAVPQFSWQAP